MRKFFSVLGSVVFFLLSGVALAWILFSIFALVFLQDVHYSIAPISYLGLQKLYPIYIILFVIILLTGLVYKKVEKKILYIIILVILSVISILTLLYTRGTDYDIFNIWLSDLYENIHLNYIGGFTALFMIFMGYKLSKRAFFLVATMIVVTIIMVLSFIKIIPSTLWGYYLWYDAEILNIYYIFSFISLFIIFFGYKIMKRKLFLVAIASWILVISGCLVYWNQPIKGLEDVPESVFALPENIKSFSDTIPQEKCEQLKKSAADLDENSIFLNIYRPGKGIKQLIPDSNPLKNIFIEYITTIKGVQDFDWRTIADKDNDLISANIRREILRGNFLEKDLRELYKGEAIQKREQQEKNMIEIHQKWVDVRNKYPDALKEIRTILYPENEKAIKDFIILIDDITRNTVGICRDSVNNTLSSRMTQMSYVSNIQVSRILNNYAFILIENSDYEGAYSVLKTLIEYTNHISKNQGYALIGGMVYRAMQNITYSSINTFTLSLPKSYQIKLAKDIENTMPISEIMMNMYRGEYLSSLYFPEYSISEDGAEITEDVSIHTLAIPIVFDTKETNLIYKNCLGSLMNEIDKNITKGKYNCEELSDIAEKQPGFHNYIGRRGVISSLGLTGYRRIFLLGEIQKNTLLQKLRGQDSVTSTIPDDTTSPCRKAGGQWSAEFRECLGIDATTCESIGGKFNECASACRNDPKAEICTMQCVQVCDVK